MTGGKFSSLSLAQDRNSVSICLDEANEIQSFVPSRMKYVSTFDVKTDGFFKVKRRILVITTYGTNMNSSGKIKDKKQHSSHPITI